MRYNDFNKTNKSLKIHRKQNTNINDLMKTLNFRIYQRIDANFANLYIVYNISHQIKEKKNHHLLQLITRIVKMLS